MLLFTAKNLLSAFIESCKQLVDGLCINLKVLASILGRVSNFCQGGNSIGHNLEKELSQLSNNI